LSGRGLCDELITRPEESYRLWCVVVCDIETSRMGAPYIYDISCLRVNDLTFILLTWRKWLAPNNASRQQMGFNSGFKGLMRTELTDHWLRAGGSGDRIPVGPRFSAPVQSGPVAHPASCTMGSGSFPGVKSGQGVTLTLHSLLVPWS